MTDFRFASYMVLRAQEQALILDADQQELVNLLDTLGRALASGQSRRAKGLYVWGRTGRGKSFIVDHFFASLPLAEKRRVHFHYFFRELHQRLNASPAPALPAVLAQMTDGCRLLCFDEFHLHDPGDAMLVKALLTRLFQRDIILLATSNYPPDQLLANPLYHERFVPSIMLIKQHMTIAALNGEEDYRASCAGGEPVLPGVAAGAALRAGPPGAGSARTCGAGAAAAGGISHAARRLRAGAFFAFHFCPAVHGGNVGDGLSGAVRTA